MKWSSSCNWEASGASHSPRSSQNPPQPAQWSTWIGRPLPTGSFVKNFWQLGQKRGFAAGSAGRSLPVPGSGSMAGRVFPCWLSQASSLCLGIQWPAQLRQLAARTPSTKVTGSEWFERQTGRFMLSERRYGRILPSHGKPLPPYGKRSPHYEIPTGLRAPGLEAGLPVAFASARTVSIALARASCLRLACASLRLVRA